jgi:flagellar protein FlgJ
MTIPSATVPAADTPVYTDLKGLSALKRGAAAQDPTAIRKVAEQFESMFTRMMLKSMRDAVGKDPMFGSDQQEMYQGMADDQLSVQLSKGRGLGLADMLVRQLQKMGVPGAAGAVKTTNAAAATSAAGAAAAYSATQRASSSPTTATAAVKTNFIRDMWPEAQQAGRQLGIDPGNIVAQAALETNWGQSLPQDSTGRSSNNLFGVKATGDWTGANVAAGTTEFDGGAAVSTTTQFRAYSTSGQSFQDYVALLRDNPRYSATLNTGGNAQAFAAGLQRGGYATDPDYVHKISAIAQNVASLASGAGVTDLKLSDALPIPANTGAL